MYIQYQRCEMRKKTQAICLLYFVIGALLLHPQTIQYSNLLPEVAVEPGQIVISAKPAQTDKTFALYYKTQGLEQFQVRKMKCDNEGNVYYQLSTETLYGDQLEYYIVEYQNESSNSNTLTPVFTVKNFSDKESPEIFFQDAPISGGGDAPREPILNFNGSLSAAGRIHDSAEFPGESFKFNGNLRVYKNVIDNDNQFDIDTTFTYMNHVTGSESKFNPSSMMVRFKKGNGKVEAGDLYISNTEFTTSYLNRRGFQYELNGETLYVNSFYANSQQKTGFEGFGIPPASGSIFGAVIGLHKASLFKVRGLFMTGKDTLDSKTLFGGEEAYREGNMMSVWGELNLMKSKLTLKGEYAHSNFGKAADEASLEKEGDNAWKAGVSFNSGVVSANADYKKIGSKFNSIANLFLQNDREGLNSNVMLNIKTFSLTVSYMDQKSYLDSPIQPMLHSKNLNTRFNWLIANHLQLGAEYGVDNLDYDQSTGLQTGGTDMDTVKYAGTIGYISGSNSVTVRLGKTESKTFTSNVDGSVALSLRFGQFLTLSPTFSYQSTENFSDNSTSKIYNVYLSSEISFIPQLFTLSISGSYTKNDNTFSDSTSMMVSGNLNFYMSKFFNYKIQPSLSLRTSYQDNKFGDLETDSLAIYLQADVSF